MKYFVILLLLSVMAHAEDFTTIDGVIHSGSISRVELDGLVIVTDSGIEKIPFANLPPEVQKKYNYDPEKAAKYAASVAAARQQLATKMAAERQAIAAARATQTPDAPKSAPSPADNSDASPSQTPRDTFLHTSQAVVVRGQVVQRTEKGLLIDCDYKRDGKIGNRAKGLIWLTGVDGREDAIVSGMGTLVGTYTYTTVTGAERVADCYQWVSGSIK